MYTFVYPWRFGLFVRENISLFVGILLYTRRGVTGGIKSFIGILLYTRRGGILFVGSGVLL